MAAKLDPKDPNILSKIEKLIKKGNNPSKYEKILDDVLGTGLTDRDSEIESAWEDSRKEIEPKKA